MLPVEALWPSTSACDRDDKFADCRALPSLHRYLRVDVHEQRRDVYRKRADGLWVMHPTRAEEPLVLASVELTLATAAPWAGQEPNEPIGPAAAGAATDSPDSAAV